MLICNIVWISVIFILNKTFKIVVLIEIKLKIKYWIKHKPKNKWKLEMLLWELTEINEV